jgi:hypothetical protein
MTDIRDRISKASQRAINKLGPTKQANKASEECQEFIDELAIFRSGHGSAEAVAREVWDVTITNQHMHHILTNVIGAARMQELGEEKLEKFLEAIK